MVDNPSDLVDRIWASRRLEYGLGIVVLALTLLIGCGRSNSHQTYARARAALDAEVSVLPLPPGSRVLARRDGTAAGQVEACACVTTELLVGNSLPSTDVYKWYKDALVARGWQVRLEATRGVALVKDRAGIEVSDLYYVSAVARHDKIKSLETQFESLVLVDMAYQVHDVEACDEVVKRLEKR